MRFVDKNDLASILNSGRSIEQMLGLFDRDGFRIVNFIRIDREKDGEFSMAFFEVIDEGSRDFLDVYEFSPYDPDSPYGSISKAGSPEEIIDMAVKIGASPERFVNAGVIQDEYKDLRWGSN